MAIVLHALRSIKGAIFLILSLITIGCSSPEDELALQLNLANKNLDHGSPEQAIIILEELKISYPNHPEILENLAFAFTATEEFHTAAFYFSQLAEKFPDKIEYYKFSAQSWEKTGDLNAAIMLFEAYILRNPRDWKTWRNLADLYLTTRQTSKAIRAYANSSQLRFDPELSLKAALLANSTGNLRDAEKGFFSLLQVADPAVAQRAHVGLLVIKHKRRQWEAAEGLLEMLDNNFPGAVEAEGLSRVREDLAIWKQALRREQRRKKEEEERRKRLMKKQRERALQLAAIREAAKRKAAEAAEETAEAAEEAAEEAEAAEEVAAAEGEVAAVGGEATSVQDSIEEPPPMQEKPQEKPSPEQQALEKARMLLASNPSQAVAQLWTVINRGMDSAEAFRGLSLAYSHLGEYTASEMTALEALRRQPGNIRMLLGYLNALQRNKTVSQVIGEIRKYRSKYPQNADLLLMLARTCAKPGGEPIAARNYYRQFFSMAPNHPEIDRARREASQI